MRAWYHTKDGKQANLCQFLGREITRLIVIDGPHMQYTIYPTWAEAVTALLKQSADWISDLTGKPLREVIITEDEE